MTFARYGRELVATASLLATVAVVAPATADEKQACATASEKAQQLRSAGKLGEARDQLTLCGRQECPKLIQQDCTQWMSEVLANMPSVVPGAKDRAGRDLVDVRLTIDGTAATTTLDGKPIVLDPGVHSFVFETKGAPTIKEQVVVKPGEKMRIVSVTFATPDDAKPFARRTPAEESRDASPPYAAYVLGGLGVVAGAVALVIDLGATSDAHNLRDTCAPRCNQSDVDDVSKRYTIAGVTAGIGAALLVTGVVLYFVHGANGSNGGSSRTGKRAPSFAVDGAGAASAALLRF